MSSARRPSISASSARRPSISSSSASCSSLAKRRASAENSSNPVVPAAAKVAALAAGGAQQAKKRVALGNLTNQGVAGRTTARAPAAKDTNNVSACSASTVKRRSSTSAHDMGLRRSSVITPSSVKASTTTLSKAPMLPMNNVPKKAVAAGTVPCSTAISPNESRESISLDESMSTCDSMKSPEFEYIDNADSSAVSSLERRTSNNLHTSENPHTEVGHMWKRDVAVPMETADSIIDVDTNHNDPQLCAALACDIYKHLCIAETSWRGFRKT